MGTTNKRKYSFYPDGVIMPLIDIELTTYENLKIIKAKGYSISWNRLKFLKEEKFNIVDVLYEYIKEFEDTLSKIILIEKDIIKVKPINPFLLRSNMVKKKMKEWEISIYNQVFWEDRRDLTRDFKKYIDQSLKDTIHEALDTLKPSYPLDEEVKAMIDSYLLVKNA